MTYKKEKRVHHVYDTPALGIIALPSWQSDNGILIIETS